MNYIVITGNVVDGLVFFGPFPDIEAANTWSEWNIYYEWTIAEMCPVKE